MRQNRRNVRRDEIFAFSHSDDDRRPQPRRDQLVRLIGRHCDESVDAADIFEHLAECSLEAETWIVVELLLDQMCDYFGVGLGLKAVILFLQLAFEIEVVFDDAVVNDADAP